MMKLALAAFLAATTISSTVIAGNFETPATPTAPLTVDALTNPNWGGFYLGGLYAFESGDWDIYKEGELDTTWATEGDKYGAFAGYNIQRDALVFGGELAYSSGETLATYNVLTQDLAETIIDAKARVGYALGDILLYGVAGGTWATIENSGTSVDLNGLNYGAGAQMKFGNGMFIGAEYLIRDLSGVSSDHEGVTYEYTIQSVALRAGWQF